MKAASEWVPVTRRLLRYFATKCRPALRSVCWVRGHRDVLVRRQHHGLLTTGKICDRCRRVDHDSISVRRWNRAARRRAARTVARKIVR